MSKTSESLDTYLAQIGRELRQLPAQARADELREIEAHLRALVLASRQLEDIGEAEATAAALKQFGVPRRVGRNLRRAWERRQPEAWWRAVVAPIAGVVFFALFSLSFETVLDLSWATQRKLIDAFFDTSWIAPLLTFGIYSLLGFGCLSTGIVMGHISPKRSQLIFISLLAIFSTIAVWENAITFSVPGDATVFSGYVCGLVVVMLGIRVGAHRARRRTARIAN